MPTDDRIEMLAYEAFIRRASQLDLPFMLKGSYITRQYFPDPNDRIPNDLDWVYLPRLEYPSQAARIFSIWMTKVTELVENDGVRFRSFKENDFWRMIDYAMAEDFPTVNTDLKVWVEEELLEACRIDISFNLLVDTPPVPLVYRPIQGKPFTIPYTTPLSLQVSWKLHQTLVRPRFKDLFDLIHLVQHPSFSPAIQEQTLHALADECATDNTDISRLDLILSGDWDKLFRDVNVQNEWKFFRFGERDNRFTNQLYEYKALSITDPDKLPDTLDEFIDKTRTALLPLAHPSHPPAK